MDRGVDSDGVYRQNLHHYAYHTADSMTGLVILSLPTLVSGETQPWNVTELHLSMWLRAMTPHTYR